ncbi:hypothetical protein [Sporolactobacillus spathodeae]|uniref:Na+-transporting methylmalonyl-CoA/oxaloacetate decarboxylase gamma subunit n=1 Tax=Sporolactobacillus spathodeae TaxID=1465502 RepID=A0ABS2QBI1_9BACL|nr:hypothetical protein [Sporolactobacillus spathodeae]MBM7659129.1 Na+-transporting methylmalonyl-CoA/oxaloacetate decarboxylase gamma subunit [Sporolactobacillus spathodeae]
MFNIIRSADLFMIILLLLLAYIVYFVRKVIVQLKQRKESFDAWHNVIVQVNQELKRIQDVLRNI